MLMRHKHSGKLNYTEMTLVEPSIVFLKRFSTLTEEDPKESKKYIFELLVKIIIKSHFICLCSQIKWEKKSGF